MKKLSVCEQEGGSYGTCVLCFCHSDISVQSGELSHVIPFIEHCFDAVTLLEKPAVAQVNCNQIFVPHFLIYRMANQLHGAESFLRR
jgi:hypothetical protein